MFNFIKKAYPEYFEGKDILKESEAMRLHADKMAEKIEEQWLEQVVNEDTMPLFDFEINLNDTD